MSRAVYGPGPNYWRLPSTLPLLPGDCDWLRPKTVAPLKAAGPDLRDLAERVEGSDAVPRKARTVQ